MALYTPLCHEDIFPEESKQSTLITYQGKSLFVKQNEFGELQSVQLLSTDPQDFLNESFSPGTVLSNEFIQQLK